MLDPVSAIMVAAGTMAATGGGGGGGGYSQVSTLTPGQRKLLDELTSQLFGQIGQGITPYGGQRVAGISPLMQTGFNLAGGMGQNIGAGYDIMGQSLGQFDPSVSQNLLGSATDALKSATQPFEPSDIMGALQPGRELALSTFEKDITPFLLEKFGATSGASGPMNKALTEAGANLSLGLGAQAFPYLMQGQQNQLNRQMQGAGMFGNLAQLPGQLAMQGTQLGGMGTDLLSQLMNIGQIQRGVDQQGLGAGQQLWTEAQPYNNPWLGLLGPALGTGAVENIYQPAGQNWMSAMMPSIGAYAGAGGFNDMFEGMGEMFGNILNKGSIWG